MAITQFGYVGGIGPMFRDDAPGGGKYVLLQGQSWNGVAGLYAKQPAYASNIGLNPSDYVMGSYADNQRVSNIPTFKQPATGPNFSGFDSNVGAMVEASTVPGQTSGGTTTTTGGGSTTTGGGSTTTGGGSTTTGGGSVTTGGDTTFSAPTIMEQITTFLSNYWWLVAIILVALLWKPFLAPALGMGKRKRR